MSRTPWAFYKELDRNFKPMRYAINLFYLRENRMPTFQELKALTRESLGSEGLLWERYGKNRFGQESYYHYGYEKGECMFFVDPAADPSEMDKNFQHYILPVIGHTLTELEHEVIFENLRQEIPHYFILRPAVLSSVCLDLLDLMQAEHPDRFEEIREELIREKKEGTYESICVFSKPFQEKLAGRKMKGVAHSEEKTQSNK
jgi:hypothetical protein